MTEASGPIRVVPAHDATWGDLQTVFGAGGSAHRCQCQRFKLFRGESFGSMPVAQRQHRLRDQTYCGRPRSGTTSGLVAYLADEPVGWCAVEPRSAYVGMARVMRVPWAGREEDRRDPRVWAVTCVLTRVGFRRQGVSRALVGAAVDHARRGGAHALEAYPMTTTEAITEELGVGIDRVFLDAGFEVVSRPTRRRVVVRREL